MKSLHHFILIVIWCTSVTVIKRTDTFLFRRAKPFHQLVNDPYQVKPEKITAGNIFKWLNMKNHVKFKLWTRRNPRWAHEIVLDDIDSISSSNYDSRRLIKIIVHGWAHSANEVSIEDWILSLRDAYLRLADLNIIFIDYTMFALPTMYFTAAPVLAAQRLAELIQFLVRNGADYSQIHIIGISWGAQVAGIAGHKLNGSLSRITGLDPANPTFRLVDNSLRLDKTDAMFVDVIHTGGGPFTQGYLGLEYPINHVDFYPNGGEIQPGCRFHWTKLDEGIECNHARAVWYFIESINSPYAFPACRCDTWDEFVKGLCPCREDDEFSFMGEYTPRRSRGIFYLFTRGKNPFGMGLQMNLTLQSIDEYDPDWNKYDHTNHNFTSSSAKQYLTKIIRKSIQKMPEKFLPLQAALNGQNVKFKASLLENVKKDSNKFQYAIWRNVRQTVNILESKRIQ